MRIVGILTLVVGVLYSNIVFAYGYELFKLDFETKSFQSCDEYPCDLIKPKDWTPSEAELVTNIITKLKLSGLRPMLTTLKALDYTMERSELWYEVSYQFETYSEKMKNNSFTAVTIPRIYTITFTDAFFNYPIKVDERSNARVQELTVLHEMAHAFDAGRFSEDIEFLQLAGFDTDGDFLSVKEEELVAVRKKKSELYDKGLYLEAYNLDRSFGMEHGLPRAYSMTPAEAFADLVAFIYFDRTAPEYINKKLIDYIDKNVLNGARAY